MALQKHVNYFALEKACEQPGCPLCTIINERIDRYIDGMLFENISDRTFRREYREAGGFCPEHAKKLLTYRDGLAVAILGQGTLTDYLEDFSKKKMRKYKRMCPVCEQRLKIENDFLTFIAEAGDVKKASVSRDSQVSAESARDLKEFFTKSDGLCVPHYAQLIKIAKHVPKWLSEFQEGKFKSLLERTSTFIDASAWGNHDKFNALSDNDKIVWKELAENLRGKVGE
jgi:hypothetical protein